MRVGFIGRGYMGKPMAENIARAGFDLRVYDIRKEAVEDLEKLGAAGAGSSKEVAASSECVITMVLNDAQTEEVVLGRDGVLEGMKEGVLIIMSTVNPSLVRGISGIFKKEKGIPVLDAPVSGVTGTAGGTLCIMVGGPEDVLETVRPVLKAMGRSIFYCGASGAGAIAKVTNALVWEVSWNAVAQALDLGAREGLDKDLLLQIYNQGTAECWATKNWGWVEEMRTNAIPGALDLEYKDMRLVVDFAREAGVPAPLIELCYQNRT